jgi:6-pyruvoyltetrahydropterin/6-carboxytetrahydropterin synthase
VDFSVIKERLCAWLDENWDHRTLLFREDPLTRLLDASDGIVVVDFNPTAENIAAHLLSISEELLLGTEVEVVAVKVHETLKCSATAEKTYLVVL